MLRGPLVRSLFLVLAAASVSAIALAKGGPGTQAGTMTAEKLKNIAGLKDRYVGGNYSCPAPTDAQCVSTTYADTNCGLYYGARVLAGTSQVCQARCADVLVMASQCLDDEWLSTMCGRHEARLMALPGAPANHVSRCVRILNNRNRQQQQANGTLFPNATLGPVIVPVTEQSGAGSPPLTVGSRATVRRPAYQPRIEATGGEATMHGRRATEQTQLSNPLTQSQALTIRSIVRGIWDNGVDVSSCEEYLFEKYYDYNVFEDAIATLGNDHRAIFDVAYAQPEAGPAAPRSALGTRGTANVAQAQFDGTTLSPQAFPPIPNNPKNIYFSFEVATAAERQMAISDWQDMPESDRYAHPFHIRKLVLLDADLHARLSAGLPGHTDHWAYHRSKADALLPNYLDEELYEFDRIKRRYERLLHRRAEYVGIMTDIIEDASKMMLYDAVKDALALPFDPADIVSNQDHVYDPYDQTLGLQEQVRENLAITLGTTLMGNQGVLFDGFSGAVPRSAMQSGSFGFGGRTGGANAFLLAGENLAQQLPQGVYAADPLGNCLASSDLQEASQCLLKAIAITDAELEEELKLARDLACLDAGDQPCDWSPAHFTQRLHDPYTAYREPDYNRCKLYTATLGFDALRNATFRYEMSDGHVIQPVVGGQSCINGDYTTSPTMLERYTHCLDRLRLDLVAYLTQQTGSESIISEDPPYRLQIGSSASDAARRGNKRFASDISYDGTWSMTDFPMDTMNPDYCEVRPSFYGEVELGGTANRKETGLFRAQASLTIDSDEESYASVEVMGNEILGLHGHLGGGQFNVIEDSDFRDQTFVEARATIVVVIVPVTFRAGITGRVGASIALGAGPPAGTSGGCVEGNQSLSAEFRPSAGVSGYMSAALDVLIVEAGVKGEIELITLELPLRMELALKGARRNNRVEPTMTVKTSMDLVFATLRGRISAFVEVCFIVCERYEETIFRWDGLRFASNLFKSEFEVPMAPLVDYNATL